MSITARIGLVALLALGVAGSAAVGQAPDQTAPTAPYLSANDELRRFAAAGERADRQQRETVPPQQAPGPRVLRGAAPEPSPTPAPPPPPAAPDDSGSAPPPDPGPVPASCSEYSGNRATGCTLLLDWGFSIDQMSCLDNLWTKESGWNHLARNPSSGAYGIPQSLPGDKMASAGSDWQTNPATQITWGLGYIENRYGTPCSAWQFFQNNNWY